MSLESAAASTANFKFEQALKELETTMRELEDGSTTLDEALTKYERGVALVKQCYAVLGNAEQRIKELTGIGADGKPELKDFTHTAAVEKTRPSRRSNPENGESSY